MINASQLPVAAPGAVLPLRPKTPVFGWSNFKVTDAPGIPSVEDLPYTVFTTSGRSAIFQALLQLKLPPDSAVLLPTYHCPTMVAPVLLAGHKPVYFGIRPDGLPDVQNISPAPGGLVRAMVVSHYFGLAQSLHEVRAWCDARGVALIEDCAHCYFGQAGELPIGAWGDYCTASLSKFFPVPEAGLLASARHAVAPLALAPQWARAQIKGCVDVLETSVNFERLRGLNSVLSAMLSLKNLTTPAEMPTPSHIHHYTAEEMMQSCDMARIKSRPLLVSALLRRVLPRGRMIALRQRNFKLYADLLRGTGQGKTPVALPGNPTAPYVFPIWIDDADRVYHALRHQGVPVFRWDRIWPGTPTLAHDVGLDWSQHMLQLLCHQDLGEDDIRYSASRLLQLL